MLKKQASRGGGWNPLDSNSYDDLQYLVVDTSLFSAEFQSAVISALSSSLSDFDSHINGTLIHSDNFQALNLLQARYREQVKCIYIDPPYNTGGDGFIYKDGYQKSSWLSLIKQTTIFSKKILNPYSSFFAMNIDKRQLFDGKILLDEGLSQLSFVNAIVNVNNPKGRSDQKHLPTAHDNILLYATDGAISYGWQPQNKVLKRYNKLDTNGKYREIDLRKTGDNDLATDRPKMAYSFAYNQENEHLLPIELGDLIPQGYIEIIPMKTSEIKGRWRWEYKTAKENISRLIAKFQPNKQQWTVFEKDYLGNDEKVLPTSVWDEKPFNSERGTEIFVNLGFEKELFPRPKPVGLLEHLLEHLIDKNSLVLDYFAGSGTTAHAVINLNREDNGNRQYILVEQGEYFDTVLKPRVQKVIFSKEYKDGKPVPSDKVSGSLNGVPQIVKVLKLESYEDTLNNLELHRSNLFDRLQEQAQHDYLLHYMLNIESRDSLLNVSHFAKPFDYGLNISTTSAGAYEWQKVDLVETFNYLIGARVIGIDDKRIEKGFVAVECRLPNQSGDDKTLIIWRDCEKWNYDNLYSEEEFGRNFRGCKTTLFGIMNFNPKHSKNLNDNDYVQVYINGDHTLETVWDGEQSGSLKIRSIEAEFLALMFAGDE
ncbi:site-specific DNA-methyltransferase [Moraxella cuniculi]|uniref:site-specific DNA-methyltransferase (adenine-specific) n=1 Tax=Moraxella cuniculi TaxID=34061 RepID=A0A448GX27_9GAMM|nr:site-specific DNA-methyltransferase [Moraxella cuniculi]VEG13325.1 putative methyltransferase [Moraxella cuniculi]